MNDFYQCLAESHAAHDLPIWQEIYEQAFPNMIAMHCHRADGQHQRAGIDRSVVLDNGKTIWIDEKVRGRNKKTGKVYSDIALEYVSNSRTGSPGWVCKGLLCDYIAYAIAPIGIAYLLPVHALQAAWSIHGEDWKQRFQTIAAVNDGYNTLSVCITPGDLFPAIGEVLRPRFTPVENFSE